MDKTVGSGLKVRLVEEPAGYPPISFSMLIHVRRVRLWISVKLMSSLIGGKFLYGSKQHSEYTTSESPGSSITSHNWEEQSAAWLPKK
jgi:hypothetical protein